MLSLALKFIFLILIRYLGKVFPPLGWLVDWFLLYPVGSTPPGQAFACFFINLIYLWQLIAVLLFAYYILNPLWQWARRQYTSLYLLIIGFRAQLGVRMDYIIQTNESILINIKSATRDAYRRQIAEASRNQPIASAIGRADPERAEASATSAEDSSTLSFGHRITAEMLRKLSHEDPAAANAIIDQQSQIEEKRLRITKQLIELGSRMGITPERLYAEMGKPSKTERFMGASTSRSMQKRWQQITSLLQVPVEYTPTFASARLKSEMRREKTKHNAELSGLFPGGDAE